MCREDFLEAVRVGIAIFQRMRWNLLKTIYNVSVTFIIMKVNERTVSLCKNFTNILTKDNENLSNILHVVTDDTKTHPEPTRLTYSNRKCR